MLLCPRCGKPTAVRLDGRLALHRGKVRYDEVGWCPGSELPTDGIEKD